MPHPTVSSMFKDICDHSPPRLSLKHFHHLKKKSATLNLPPSPHPPCPPTQSNHDSVFCLYGSPYSEFPLNIHSHGMRSLESGFSHLMCSRSAHAGVCIGAPPFSWLSNISLYVFTCTTLCINSFCNGHLGCFHFLAVMKNARYKYSCIGFCVDMFSFVLARIDGSYGNFIFNHLKSQMVFQSDCTILRLPSHVRWALIHHFITDIVCR